MSPRARLILAGVLAGAALSMTQPAREAVAAWRCTSAGGEWLGHEQACEFATPASDDGAHDAPTPLFEESR